MGSQCCQLFAGFFYGWLVFVQRISVQLGPFHGNMGCSCFVCGRTPLLNDCCTQHRFREEYLSRGTGGICAAFSPGKGTGAVLVRDDEKGGEKVGDMLLVFLCPL